MILTPIDRLIVEAEDIQEFLEQDYSAYADNPEALKERGDKLSVLIARTGNMLADAKYHLRELQEEETMKAITEILLDSKLSAKVQNALMDSICKHERLLVDRIEQQNKSLKYAIEWTRSRLSMAKEELNNSRGWNR